MAVVDGLGSVGPTWLRLLRHLLDSPKTPTELAALEKKHLSQVSRALKTLRDHGFVEYKPTRSRERYYSVTNEGYAILRRTDTLIR